MGRLLRFWSLPRREKQFFCEAAILLLLSHLSIKTIAFRHIDRFLRARWNNGARDALDVAEVIQARRCFVVARGQSIAVEEPVPEPIDGGSS